MILPNPSDAALKSADAITLFDPKVASYVGGLVRSFERKAA